MERSDFRQPLQEVDTGVIGAFGGLSSASTSLTGNITHAQKLTNAFVNKRNEITRRTGSSIVSSVPSVADPQFINSLFFTFDNQNYLIYRNDVNLVISSLSASGAVVDTKTKVNAFSSPNENTSFSVVVENLNCFVLCASRSRIITILCLLKRDANVISLVTPTTPVVSLSNFPSGSVTTANKAFLYNSKGVNLPVVALVQTSFSFAFTTATTFVDVPGENPKVHLCFVCRGTSAAYYPGSYLYGTALRKNIVPLDVNVAIPENLSSNPILNEPSTQRLEVNTTVAYRTNSASPTLYTRVFNNKPATETEYEFSDGSYRVDPNVLSVRSSSFISFGALESTTDSTFVYLFRLRSTAVVLPNYFVQRSKLIVHVNRVLFTPLYSDSNLTNVVDDTLSVDFVRVNTPTSPGINPASVVEMFYSTLSSVLASSIVDLSRETVTIFIDDFYSIPIYGLSAASNVGGLSYPTIVQTVGNRVVMTGFSNRVAVSASDWDYRGIGWNNFQVSSIDFSETSAYLLSITQSTSSINFALSVNGVLILGTDRGVYRVSGDNANAPPNARSANVSRISNEVVSNQNAATVYKNRIFFVSLNGLYTIAFADENQELNATPISTEVSDYFTNNLANSISYSEFYRAFIIGFANTNELLLYFLESETYAIFRLGCNGTVRVIPSLDGYQLTIPTTTTGSHVLFAAWDKTATDISNVSSLPALSNLLPLSQSFLETPSVSTLVTPSELLDSVNPSLRQSYGYNSIRALSGSVVVAEGIGVNLPIRIISSLVTKAFMPTKLLAANRVRAVCLLISGSGSAISKVVYNSQDYNDRLTELIPFAVDASSGYNGESLLNYQFFSRQSVVGDCVNVTLGVNGISEAWALAIVWDGQLKIHGYQFDTSSKKRRRLR